MNELIDTKEAAALLDLTDRQVRNLLKSGLIKGQKFGGETGQWVIDKESVLQYKTQREAETQTDEEK